MARPATAPCAWRGPQALLGLPEGRAALALAWGGDSPGALALAHALRRCVRGAAAGFARVGGGESAFQAVQPPVRLASVVARPRCVVSLEPLRDAL